MSFIPFIRDYIELLNNIYDSVSNDINVQKIFQETIIYIFQTFKVIFIYILTFQWFRDLIYLPVIIPQISNSIFKENFYLQTPLENIFTILEIPSYNTNKFLIGFLNSFFLALPISCAHLIYVRRLLVQGNIAGLAAGLGNILGQICFIGSVILGFRFLIVPWFSFEPLSYIVGCLLLLNIIYDMVHERVIKIVDWNNKSTLFKIFILNFLLIWTEQSCIFQYLGNLTLEAGPSVLNNFSATTNIEFLFIHLNYLLGLFIGSLVFNFVIAYTLKAFTEFIQIKFSILRSTWIIRLNYSLLTLTLAFTFTSIPFYGLDYILTQPLGFISQDKAFRNTIFSPNEVKDSFGILGGLSENLSLNTDVTSFDRGFYLKSPILQTFEDLNYSGEYASVHRQGNIPLFDQYKEKARKIREIIVKKSESEKETLLQNSDSKKNDQINFSEKSTNLFDYPTYYPIDNNVFISSNIQRRFEITNKYPYNSILENFLDGTLNSGFSNEKFTIAYPEIDKKIKQKYYSNPVYKFLLSTDIDNFLKRQPSQFLLSPLEEKELYKKRLILARYNDTLRFYNKLPYSNEFQYFFNGSKSFADRVYNQQFKGTLHVVRRLFSISFDSNTKNPQELVLKYDQPLFKKYDQFHNPMQHEELKEINLTKKPFLELVSQSPLYVGWDENLRKMVITNRLLNQSIANFSKPNNEESKTISFTTWPLNKDNWNEVPFKLNSRLLFETKTSITNLNYNDLIPFFGNEGGVLYYEALPNNLVKVVTGIVDVIPPNRGGFVWPGTSPLKMSFKDFFKF